MAMTAEQSTANEHNPKHEALATIRYLSARITGLAMAIEEYDVALMQSIAIRSNDTMAALEAAGKTLADLLDREVSE